MPLINLPKLAMRLPGKKPKESIEAPPNTFLGLMFVNHSVQAALWKVEGEKIETLNQSALKTFENDEDGLIQADQALRDLGNQSENVNEVIFGFDPLWVDDAGLLAAKKPFVKSLTENLGLKPVGFVVIPDALVQQILSQDKLASEVLVYLQEDTVFIHLLKQGKLVHELSVGRSGDIVQDVVEGLARFAGELRGKDAYLPAKLMLASVILSSQELDDAQQQLSSYNWSENHPFVQAPVVQSLAALDILYAVVEQGGAAVAQAKGLQAKQPHQPGSTSGSEAESFGFAQAESVAEDGDNFHSLDQTEKGQVTSFGVPMSTDDLPEIKEQTAEPDRPRASIGKRLKMPAFIGNFYQWYLHHPHRKLILGGLIGGLLGLLAALIGWVVMSYQVAISVQLAEKVIAKDVEIIIDPTIASSNIAKQILKAELEELEVSGRESGGTTGVKLVGESAKGTVVILNKTTASKTFDAGTSLTSGSLAFELDDSVTVASASDQGDSLDYGKTDANVTATEIGADGNLSKDTALTIANFSTNTYAAEVKDGLSGGSSREVRVVADEDRENLLATLTNKLQDDAAKQFAEKSGDGTYYALTASTDVVEASFDGEAGDEADQLTLDLTLTTSAVKYKSEDLRPLLAEALKDDIPEGFELIDEEPELLSDTRQEATASTRVILDANVIAKARPPLDQEALIKDILGLPLRDLIGKLTERTEIDEAKYQLKPGIAGWFVRRVPKAADRVELIITNQSNQK
jgi:hypothetical protein